MLMLSRRVRERIFVGEDIIITVMGIRCGKVYLGIDAPRGLRVDREEVRIAKTRNVPNKEGD